MNWNTICDSLTKTWLHLMSSSTAYLPQRRPRWYIRKPASPAEQQPSPNIRTSTSSHCSAYAGSPLRQHGLYHELSRIQFESICAWSNWHHWLICRWMWTWSISYSVFTPATVATTKTLRAELPNLPPAISQVHHSLYLDEKRLLVDVNTWS